MGFRYQLATPDGDLFGEAEYAYEPDVGDVIYLDGNRRARVTAFIPVERMGEFLDRPVYGVLEVEPVM